MIVRPLVQLVLAAAASLLLLRLYRAVAARDRTVARVVGAGLVLRALLGQALFWISYLHLPFARSLQLGNGIWWYASDSFLYFDRAVRAADGGLGGILAIERGMASPQHVQLLAIFVALFGGVTSVALLMNLFAYLGACLAIPGRSTSSTIAIAAISVSPPTVLWSLQPLKDTLFIFLLAALFAAATRWPIAFPPIVFLIAGIRWYYGIAILAAMLLFFVFRKRAAAMSIAVFAASTVAFIAGAGPYLVLLNDTVRAPVRQLDAVRVGFKTMPGATVIHSTPLPARGERVAEGRVRGATRQFLANTLAVTVPHVILQRTGIVDIGGGRGLWLFADVDTVIFDGLLLYAAVAIGRAFRRRIALAPLVVFAVALAILTAIPIVYGVTQFAALFRFRSAIALLVAMIPVAVAVETTVVEEQSTQPGVTPRTSLADVAL